MTADLVIIGKLADLCRAKGVKAISVDGVTIEMGAPEVPPMKADAKKVDADMCACGCPMAGHQAGLCAFRGCSPDKCAGEEVKP